MQSTKGDVAFSIDSLLEQPEKLSERGVTELYLHDEALSKDRKKIIQVLELLSQKESPFVSILTNVQTIDRELAQKAADSLCSLEIPLAASVKGEALLFDKHLFAKKAVLLNEAGAVFGFSLDWGLLANDRAKLFRERLDFAIDQYPNHIDFPQLESGEIAKSTAVFSSRDMELCADLAFACQTFYSEGRAVPWFKTVLESLRIKPAVFFSDTVGTKEVAVAAECIKTVLQKHTRRLYAVVDTIHVQQTVNLHGTVFVYVIGLATVGNPAICFKNTGIV
jgi:hypothetical protein